MGRRGPAPAPVEVQLRRGEAHLDRLRTRAPKARLSDPWMPRDMSAAAKTVWQRTLREQPPGLIRGADGDLLRLYCEAVARYVQAVGEYTAPTVEGMNGGRVANPLHRITRDLADTIRLMARELGIGPASRAGMQVEAFGDTVRATSIDDEIGPPARLRVVGSNAP